MSKIYFLATLCALGLTACGGDSGGDSAPISSAVSSNPYLPAQYGAVWQYSNDNSGQSYQITSSPVTVHPDGSETFSLSWAHSGFSQSFEYKDAQLYLNQLTFNQVLVNDNDYRVKFDMSNEPFLLLPEYAELGDRLSRGYTPVDAIVSPNVGNTHAQMRPRWKNYGIETISTQHGTYEAIHLGFTLAFDVSIDHASYGRIDLDQVSLMQELWFSPGIGIIKIKDTSASLTSPTELSLDTFNRYHDQEQEIAPLPVSIEVPSNSPWKNLQTAYGLDDFYGTWAELTHQCSPAPLDNARYQLTLTKENFTLRKVAYDGSDCGVYGTNVYKTESIKSGRYRFVDDGLPSDWISLTLEVDSETLRYKARNGIWGSYYPGTPGVQESVTLQKMSNGDIAFEIYEMGRMHAHTLRPAS